MTRWVTHKFGGTSLADAAAYRAVADIVSSRSGANQAVVVSAMAGVTDELIELVERARRRDPSHEARAAVLAERQIAVINELLGVSGADLAARVEKDFSDIADILRGSSVMGHASRTAVGTVAGYGEIWSAQVIAAVLEAGGSPVSWLDAREVLVVAPSDLAPVVDWEETGTRFRTWLEANEAEILVVTGYIASEASGAPTTLGRNGSDYSASIFGALLETEQINIWTDVDGVMSADPRLVPQTMTLQELSYNEAMELAYFGAKVIHPATMTPAIRTETPIVIRNTFNPSHPGTQIRPVSSTDTPVKGFASIGGIALLNLEGTAMIGVPGISERLFGALREGGVSVIMISQGSSEHSICFAIPESQADHAAQVVEKAFLTERQFGQIQQLEVTDGCTILAAVGDGMSGTPGVAARFFSALARAGVNVRAIAQGSSERNISVVIDAAEAARALRAAHSGFYLSSQTLSIGLVGPGHVGGALIDQMKGRLDWLRDEFAIDLRVRAIATSSTMLLDEHQIDLADWREALASGDIRTTSADLGLLADYVHTENVPHAAIVDCSASEDVASRYRDWLARGIHVVTPNKKANSGDIEYYRRLRESSRRANAHYFYETTVGAALPIIQTLRDLVQTGDEIHRIEGIFSGTLSYLFNSFDGTAPFSEIVTSARAQGYTEPDPREDLSGMDVARKVVILAREMGLEVSLSDIPIESLIPPGLEEGSVEEFLVALRDHDVEMARRVAVTRERGEVLRFVGVIDPVDGCRISLETYDTNHPFARIRLTDNIVVFYTGRYRDNPLVVQGPGAGPDVTAGGVFADILRLANYLGSTV